MCDGRSSDWASDLFVDVRPFSQENVSGGLTMATTALPNYFVGDRSLVGNEMDDAFEEFRRNGVDMDLEVDSDCGSGFAHQLPRFDGYPWTTVVNERADLSPTHRKAIGVVDRLPTVLEDGGPSSSSSTSPSAKVNTSTRSNTRRGGQCVFCRNNGASRIDYESHVVKDRSGRVTCPVLRSYKCPICGVHGDNAHTIRYCPQNKHRDRAAIAAVAMMPLLPRTTRCDVGRLMETKWLH